MATPPPSSCSPRSSPSPTWPPVPSPLRSRSWTQDVGPARFYEELFCSGRSPVPLAGLVASSGAQSDVVKRGYLGHTDRNHMRYFVLRAGSHTGPSRLEWYRNQEKFTGMEKSAGKAALFGSSKQGVIYLRCCLGVSRVGSSRKGHTVALYAKDQTLVLVVEDQKEQEDWWYSIKKLMEEEQKEEEEQGEGFDEEDDGYCTLPPAAFFKEVWPVSVRSRGLGRSKSLAGESRLCLTASSLILVRVAAGNDLPSVTIPLLSVRRFGHLDGSFFLELGRSAPNGPGEIWMEARDQGNPAVAQHIHEMVRETVRALRALPDFSRSPIQNHTNHNQLQNLLASKRCRPKSRDKLRPHGSPLAPPPRGSDLHAGPPRCNSEPRKPENPELGSALRFSLDLSPQSPETSSSSYVDMRLDRRPLVDKQEPREGVGYVMMSPQVRHSSPGPPQDEYVTMASPHKPGWTRSSSSLQTLFNSSSSDGYSPPPPLHLSPHWSEQGSGQSQRSSSCCSRPIDDLGQTPKSEKSFLVSPSRDAASPDEGSGLRFITGWSRPAPGLDRSELVQTGPGRPQAAPNQSPVRRRRLLCLPACLQSDKS